MLCKITVTYMLSEFLITTNLEPEVLIRLFNEHQIEFELHIVYLKFACDVGTQARINLMLT